MTQELLINMNSYQLMGSTVMPRVALAPHGARPQLTVCDGVLHFVSVFAGTSSGFSSFLPLFENMQVGELPMGGVCVCGAIQGGFSCLERSIPRIVF